MELSSLFAAQKYQTARPATQAEQSEKASSALAQVTADFSATLAAGERAAAQAAQSEIEPYQLVQALAQSELAVETAVALRNKVVQAYQEILRMPL